MSQKFTILITINRGFRKIYVFKFKYPQNFQDFKTNLTNHSKKLASWTNLVFQAI